MRLISTKIEKINSCRITVKETRKDIKNMNKKQILFNEQEDLKRNLIEFLETGYIIKIKNFVDKLNSRIDEPKVKIQFELKRDLKN